MRKRLIISVALLALAVSGCTEAFYRSVGCTGSTSSNDYKSCEGRVDLGIGLVLALAAAAAGLSESQHSNKAPSGHPGVSSGVSSDLPAAAG